MPGPTPRASLFRADEMSLRLKDSKLYHGPMDPNMSFPAHYHAYGMEMADVEVEEEDKEDFFKSIVHSIASFKLEGGEEIWYVREKLMIVVSLLFE